MRLKGKETLLIFRNDDDILQDTGAKKVEGLIVSDSIDKGLAFRSHKPTPTRIHLQPGRPGVPRSKVFHESGSAQHPKADSKFVVTEAEEIWKSVAGTALHARSLLANDRLKVGWVAIGFVFIFACLIYVGVTGDVSVSDAAQAAQ